MRDEHMRVIEIREPSIEPPVANVGWRARVCSRQPAARRRADRIDRHIVNRFAERVRKPVRQTFLKLAAQLHLQGVVVRVAAGIHVKDLTELRVGPEEVRRKSSRHDVRLVDPLQEVRKTVALQIGLTRGGVDAARSGEHRVEYADGLAGNARRTTSAIGSASLRKVSLRERERLEQSVVIGLDLVQIISSEETKTTLADVADLRDHPPGKLLLQIQVPLVHGWQLELRVECAYVGRRQSRCGRRTGKGARQQCRGRQLTREAFGNSQIGNRRATFRGRAPYRGSALSRKAGNLAAYCRDLEGRDRVERDAVTRTNYQVALTQRVPRKTQPRSERERVPIVVPSVSAAEADRPL